MNYLKDDAKISGISVFRAISGFGESGEHSASLVDLSLNLPLTIEFFDNETKIKEALNFLQNIVKPEHIIFWKANTIAK